MDRTQRSYSERSEVGRHRQRHDGIAALPWGLGGISRFGRLHRRVPMGKASPRNTRSVERTYKRSVAAATDRLGNRRRAQRCPRCQPEARRRIRHARQCHAHRGLSRTRRNTTGAHRCRAAKCWRFAVSNRHSPQPAKGRPRHCSHVVRQSRAAVEQQPKFCHPGRAWPFR